MPKVGQKQPTVYLGVDPGVNGGLVVIDSKRIVLEYHCMPGTDRDIVDLLRGISRRYRTYAHLEWINPSIPVIKKADAAKLYGSFISLRMVLCALDIPTEIQQAHKTWRDMKIKPKGKNEPQGKWKDRLRAKGQQLFPRLKLWKETKKIQLCCCDALIMAECCRRRELGQL